MSSEYSYDKPDEEKYLQAVIAILRQRNQSKIAELLKGCSCDICPSSQFSHRYNCVHTSIQIYVPISKLDAFSEPIKEIILVACDDAMPKSLGYDVTSVVISPSLDDIPDGQSLNEDLDHIASELSQQVLPILPADIKNKGEEMAEVYLYLYCIENSLRLFIENVAKTKFGDDWFEKIQLNRSIKDAVTQRKDLESRNAWLSVRRDSKIFFVDFKDLGSLISLNWDLFKPYFPDVPWIESKIAELAQCRNYVAHNSYVGDHEKEMIRLYYRSILKQIGAIK